MSLFKKAISILIVFVILLSTSLNAFIFNVSAATITTIYIEGSDVRIRSSASTSSSIVKQVSFTRATVLETLNKSDGTWYKVTYHNGTEQITGYVKKMSYTRLATYNPDASFETNLSYFPASYHSALRNLHSQYPNWKFIPETVPVTFDEAVYQESINMRKQVHFTDHPVSWRSMGQGSYDWSKNQWMTSNGNWTGASKEIIAYYMDPRNFLNDSSIYQFLQQTYNPAYQTEEGLTKIVAGSFLANGYTDPNDREYSGSYIKAIMAAAKESNVNPYIIASKIMQEQGDGTNALVSGARGYYNFLNIGATGSTNAEVINNGIKRAEEEKWNTRSKSLIGGAKFLANNYIARGQDTYYYQDYNVHFQRNLWNQYAQAVHDAYNKGLNLAKFYKNNKDLTLEFRIPIFGSMASTAYQKPAWNSLKNNYYLDSMVISGLTPSFGKFDYKYDLNLSSDATIFLTPVSGATYTGYSSYKILSGNTVIDLPIKAESGYLTHYYINVSSKSNYTLTVKVGAAPSGIRGDTNGDGGISLLDLANIRLHLLGKISLSGNNALGADTNGDGKITLLDLANVRLHLLGLFTIS